ncbi:MAG TPA: substrate-binding domain-containing protein, partial [Spirochaetia bacterium]|nr:substrate-binding domain-containing protein [Spirochaetia bacterium]
GIEHRAQERNLGVLCFVGSRINSPIPSESSANVAFRIADPKSLDGLIVISAAITTFLAESGVRRLFAARKDFPQVSVGVRVPGVSSITVDGTGGIKEMVRHLASVHKRRRFAAIGGPPDHAEAEQRRVAFFEAIDELGIDFDPRMYVTGTFVQESGAAATQELIATGNRFDALVCMNDRMAIGALAELRRSGVQVPDDVSVVGFDGIEEGRCVTPPLTTVVQPLREVGIAAVDAIAQLIEGGGPTRRVLHCVPSIAESCGCPPKLSFVGKPLTDNAGVEGIERATIETLVGMATTGQGEDFLRRLNAELTCETLAGADLRRWHDALSLVRRVSAASEGADGEQRTELFERARVLLAESEARHEAERRVAAENRFDTLRAISASLGGAFELPEMLQRLDAGLTKLRIGKGYLALFDQSRADLNSSRLIFVHDDSSKDRPIAPLPVSFRTGQVLPPRTGGSWRKGHWVLEPLVFQHETVGYLLLSGGIEEPGVYDSLRDQVASALKGSLLFRQVREHERSLEEEVTRRTQELTQTNLELTQEINRTARLEQEVTEISNRTMERIGQDLHDDLCQHLAGIAMLASVARDALPKSETAYVASLDKVSELLSDSIHRVKQIARGLVPSGLESHGLAAAIEALVAAARRSYTAAIEFRATPDFKIGDTDRALQAYRIVQEALANSLKHSRADHISVRLYCEHPAGAGIRTLIAEVSDSGVGLPEKPSTDGMGMRIMRYRAEKAHIQLKIASDGRGTRIICRIPIEIGGAA